MESNDLEEGEACFTDGSVYRGTWSALGMEGIGRYIMPHNVAYEGELRDGMFHGHGSLYWPRGQGLYGIWQRGELKEKCYVFEDGLVFQEHGWKYCQFPDRRFQECVKNGLRPAGETLKTGSRPPVTVIPPDSNDAGSGIYNRMTCVITSYRDPKKVIEVPDGARARWIEENCRKDVDEPTGHRPDLYENWFSDTIESLDEIFSPVPLSFTNDSFEPWWERLTTFTRDQDLSEESEKDDCCCFKEVPCLKEDTK